MVLDNLDAFIGFNASQTSKTKILTNIRLIKRHSMYSDKRKEEERYPYFFAIQITVVNSLVSFHTCLVAWRLLCWIYFCEIHVLIFCFTMIIIFFKMVHISERFRKRNLEIKYVSIQSTWGRLGSLINVTLASWQKCKQACMKSRPCRATWLYLRTNDDHNYAKWFETTVKVQRL